MAEHYRRDRRWHPISKQTFFYNRYRGILYLRTEQGLRLPLIKNFYFNMEFNWKYKSDPPSGNDKSDTAFVVGLGYELNF